MAFKTVTDLSADNTISLGGTNKKTGKKNPTSVEGFYLGKRGVADKKKKSGISYIYFFETSKGNLGVWGKTDMDNKMSTMEVGVMTRITFDRMVSTPNGDMYKYKVEFDADNAIEVTSENEEKLSAAGGNEAEEEVDEDTDSGEVEEVDEDEADQEDARQNVALSRAAQKAKVDALLAKGKSKAS